MRVAGLFVYPVKSCAGGSLDEAVVEPWGLAGDRRWLLVDRANRFVTQREESRLAIVVPAPTADGLRLDYDGRALEISRPGREAPVLHVQIWRNTVAARLAATVAVEKLLGLDLRLVYMDDPTLRPVNPEYGRNDDRVSFADGYPLLLAGTGSLDDLNRRLGNPVPMERFRPSVVVDGAEPYAEDRWRLVRIGAVRFRVAKPCPRCVVTTIDQRTGSRGDERAEPLRTLATYRRRELGILFGQNLIPDGTGTIHLGDTVEVLESA